VAAGVAGRGDWDQQRGGVISGRELPAVFGQQSRQIIADGFSEAGGGDPDQLGAVFGGDVLLIFYSCFLTIPLKQ